MIQNVVLDGQGDHLPDSMPAVPLPAGEGDLDPVRALAESMRRQTGPADRTGSGRRARPFDAQYWACWVMAIVYPVLLAYLLITH